MKTSKIIEQLRLEQIFGFVYLLLFYKHVKKAVGKKRALQILSKAARERRLSWYRKNEKDIKKGKDDFETVLNYLDQITKELSPGQKLDNKKPQIKKEGKCLVLKSWIWCPIAEACKIVNEESIEICTALEQEAEMAVIEKLCPKITYRVLKTKPDFGYCEFLLESK